MPKPILVGDHMTRSPHTVARSAKLSVAHEMMRKFNIRHLPVLDGGRLVGLVSLSDLHLIETLRDVSPDRVAVEEAMSERPFTASPTTPLAEVVRTMADKKYGGVVVIEEGKTVGVFTDIDALRVLLEQLDR